MDANMGGRVGPIPPLGKNQRFFPYRGPSYSCGDLFANFLLPFSMGGGPFWACAPSLQKFLRAPCSGVVGNFYHGIIVTYPIVIDLGGGGGGVPE